MGCQYDPYASNYTYYHPTTQEMVGEYELTKIDMEKYAPGLETKVKQLPSSPKIVLRIDGKYEADNFPFFSEDDHSNYHFESFQKFEGKWKIREAGGVGKDNYRIKIIFGLEMTGLPSHLAYPFISGRKKVDGLIFGFDDGDAGYVIIFTKRR